MLLHCTSTLSVLLYHAAGMYVLSNLDFMEIPRYQLRKEFLKDNNIEFMVFISFNYLLSFKGHVYVERSEEMIFSVIQNISQCYR